MRVGPRDQLHQRDDEAGLTAELAKPVESCMTVAERYLDRQLSLHFYLRLRPRDSDLGAYDVVAVFERLPGGDSSPFHLDIAHLHQPNSAEVVFGDGGSEEQWKPVLVLIGERGQDREGAELRPVPSVVGLYGSDPGDDGGGHSPDTGLPLAQRVAFDGLAGEDRELRRFRRLLFVGENELPSQVVEGRPQVVEEIAQDHAKARRRLLMDLDAETVVSAVRVEVLPDAVCVAVEEGSDFLLEGFQVGFGPVKLGAHSRERIYHAT